MATSSKKYQFKKRTKTSYYTVKDVEVMGMHMYKTPNPFTVGSSGGNCTWWAWGRFREVAALAGKKIGPNDGPTGNASQFYNQCAGKFERGIKPKVGSIICWGYGSPTGGDGHVAFVEYVYSNGDIEISHSGWSSGPLTNERLSRGDGKKGHGAYHRSYGNTYFNGFIYNPIEFKNPDGTDNSASVSNLSTGSSSGHTKAWYINKYGNEARVYFALRDEGLTHKAACAIMGNIRQESNFSPTVVNSIGATGLCQWYQGRCTNMKNFKSGYSWNTITHQIKYLMHELKGSYKSKVYSVLKNNNKTLKEMTYAFLRWYEVPGNYDEEINRRYPFAKTYYGRYKDGTTSSSEDIQVVGYDMKKRSSELYSSQNYKFLSIEDITNTESKVQSSLKETIVKFMSNKTFGFNDTAAVPESMFNTTALTTGPTREKLVKTPSKFELSEALIQAPFVELKLGDYTIGSYKNSLDSAPNHISNLNVSKVNGEINQYTIGLVHQIRPGEDPNLIDKVLSSVRFDKIHIRYGDCESGSLYKDIEAVITNVTQNRDYSGARITYTIYATSACNYVTGIKFNFPATVDRPSHILRKLLYDSGAMSEALISVFPGMKNKSIVDSKNLIPTNDAILKVDAKANISLIQYISYLVGCMSNESNSVDALLRNSTYYLTYEDDVETGAYFKVTEQEQVTTRAVPGINVYDLTIGYPDGNDVMNFEITDNNAWSLLYNVGSISSEFTYDVDEDGDVRQAYSLNYFNASIPINEIQKNWMTQMVNYPISAQLVIKGLLKPISLMDYINIDVRFFGQKHITSGLYAITGQQDTLSGSGFVTNIALLRVGDSLTPYVPLSAPQNKFRQTVSRPEIDLSGINLEDSVPEQHNWGISGFLDDINAANERGQKGIVTQHPVPPQETDSEGPFDPKEDEDKDEGGTTVQALYSWQFGAIGKTYTLKGKKFSSDNKKVCTVNSKGVVTAVGGGTCHITVTHESGTVRKILFRVPSKVSRTKVFKPWWDAQKVQQKWSWNSCYSWTKPTISNSRYKGTCITMPSVSAQRCHLITSGHYLTASSGTGDREYGFAIRETEKAMKSVNSKYWWHKYYQSNPQSVKSLLKSGKILEGDILHSWYHTWIYYGRDKNGNFLWNESGHRGSNISGYGPGSNRTALKHTNSTNTNETCIAIYRINTFMVTTSCKNGKITYSREWMAGQDVKITFTPFKGYKLKSLTVDGKKMNIKKYSSSYTIKNIDNTHKIKVVFENK